MKKLLTLLTICLTSPVLAETLPISVRLKPRSPEQIAAFYEARGFPKTMLDVIKEQCFITVSIKNKSYQVVWLDLSKWHFSSNGKQIKREHRNAWKKRWIEMNIPLPSQSTFRWTLLPETLDYLPNEKEGGNIILPRTSSPITIAAEFATGKNKEGTPYAFKQTVKCAVNK